MEVEGGALFPFHGHPRARTAYFDSIETGETRQWLPAFVEQLDSDPGPISEPVSIDPNARGPAIG